MKSKLCRFGVLRMGMVAALVLGMGRLPGLAAPAEDMYPTTTAPSTQTETTNPSVVEPTVWTEVRFGFKDTNPKQIELGKSQVVRVSGALAVTTSDLSVAADKLSGGQYRLQPSKLGAFALAIQTPMGTITENWATINSAGISGYDVPTQFDLYPNGPKIANANSAVRLYTTPFGAKEPEEAYTLLGQKESRLMVKWSCEQNRYGFRVDENGDLHEGNEAVDQDAYVVLTAVFTDRWGAEQRFTTRVNVRALLVAEELR